MLPLVFANSIAADMGLIPGLAVFGPALGLPLSVLAAFLERPFFSLAGVRTNTIWYSLQANFVSLLVGYIATMVVIPFVMSPIVAFVMLWPFVALAISVATEWKYIQFRNPSHRIAWEPVAVGNVVSAAVCIATLFLVQWLRSQLPRVSISLRAYEDAMTTAVAVVTVGLFVASFIATLNRRGAPNSAEPTQFEDARPDQAGDEG
jgi:hypothetical protein